MHKNIMGNNKGANGESNEDIQKLFWKLYIRRVRDNISDYEKIIIEKILSETKRGWNKKNVYLLSMIVNNQADFYDLRIILKEEMNNQITGIDMADEDYLEMILHNILMKKLGEKSKILLCFLAQYGSGFPLGFFQLLSNDEEELKEWKKAGFQLTNSGIYIQRKTRKHVQKRMNYADTILMTSHLILKEIEVKQMLEELNFLPDDSYFYPLDDSYFTAPHTMYDNEIKALHNRFINNLWEILKDKSIGYRHICSLLETEIYNVIKIIMHQNNQNLTCIPQLLFYLLHESKAAPVIERYDEDDKMQDYMNTIVTNLNDNINKSTGTYRKKYYLDIIMAIMSQSILMSRSFKIEQLDNAIEKCKEAEKNMQKYEKNELKKDQILCMDFFKQKLNILFLKSEIYLRKGLAIEHNKNIQSSNDKKNEALYEMERILKEQIEDAIKSRENKTRNHYYALNARYNNYYGKFYFIMGEFNMENIVSASEKEKDDCLNRAKNYYEEADKDYREALKFYERYPEQYMTELADVKRNLGDLYYQKAEVIDDEVEKAELKKNGCRFLIQSYTHYRETADLHGIADVMLSFGNAADFSKESKEMKKRSSLSFYDMAINLYKQLGDDWAYWIALKSRENAVETFYQMPVK